MSLIERAGQDVLPWFQEVSETTLEDGTRLVTFTDYHTAPVGTVARLGRRRGVGQLLVKRGDAWYPDGSTSAPGLTAYGLENRPAYVEVES